ncbi:MAG TPA: hypothetical protein VHV32_19490 [Candidatus Angelobacter sp.]|jgi:hypothetical protein|nr:hypothetical protein [Candidatus Angelobacter sp.]
MSKKHVVNGDQQNGWYCYACDFFTRDVAEAAAHDAMKTGLDDGPPNSIIRHERGEKPQLNPAKAALGHMLKLVEDGVLVRNTKDDGNMTAFVEQSVRLTRVLKQAQEALA